jgi:outer membrane protein assembly factor BamB
MLSSTKGLARPALSVAILLLAFGCKRNHPPSIPDVAGQLVYRPGDTAELSATAVDQDNDSLSYLFAWLDSSSAVWSGDYPNGVAAFSSHVYAESGTYAPRVKARDTRGAESDWSDAETLRVGMFPPGTPARPAGPVAWERGAAYACSTCASSPYGEQLFIQFDWGGDTGDWSGPVASDSSCLGTTSFDYIGDYAVRARARDKVGLLSAWSDSLMVTVCCSVNHPPVAPPPTGPATSEVEVECQFKVTASDPDLHQVSVRADWGIGDTSDWSALFPSGDTTTLRYAWSQPGEYHISAQAKDEEDELSPWSDPLAITITYDDTTPPVVTIVSPANGDTVEKGGIAIKAVAFDDWAVTEVEFYVDGTLVGIDSAGGAGDTFRYTWSDTSAQLVMMSYDLVAQAFDAARNEAFSATTTITIAGTEGYVVWFWMNSREGACYTSAIVTTDLDQDEVVMTSSDDYTFVSIRTKNGSKKDDVTTRYSEYDFTGHPGYNAPLGHIIVGSDEGELYALSIDGLRRDWQFPDRSPEDSLTFMEWGAPAFSGLNIYIGHDDTTNQLVLIQDLGTQGNQVAAYNVNAGVNDAPLLDAWGNVVFATNDGRLIKIDANLSSPIWVARLEDQGDVYGPIFGSDGIIYCTSDSCRLFAIDPDNGAVKWAATLDEEVSRPALGRNALFIGDLFGTAYSINPSTGAINWKKIVSQASGFRTTPVVTDSGLVYFQDDDDVLFCVNQADGTLIWCCDCPRYLPFAKRHSPRPRRLWLTRYPPNPSICANGNVIVVGKDALYCVAGYPGATLDAAAPWPKWQKNLSNSGK